MPVVSTLKPCRLSASCKALITVWDGVGAVIVGFDGVWANVPELDDAERLVASSNAAAPNRNFLSDCCMACLRLRLVFWLRLKLIELQSAFVAWPKVPAHDVRHQNVKANLKR